MIKPVMLGHQASTDVPAGASSACLQVLVELEVVTSAGRAAAVGLRLGPDLVEVWLDEHCCGVLDRDLLRAWLMALPRTPLVVDDVTFSVDRMVDRDGRVAISVPGVLVWTLSPMDFERLMGRI